MTKGIEASLEELIALRGQASQLDFSARKISHSRLAGRYHSHFRGRGMDYFESRPYVDGDDVRNIDWRVTARTGSLYSKVFVEERDRPILILADFSPSMYFGTRKAFKSVIAARMGALLAWYAHKNGDRVGGLLFTPDGAHDIRPGTGRKSVLAVLQALSVSTALPQVDKPDNRLLAAMEHATKVVRPGSLVLLLSDFYAVQTEARRPALRQALHRLSAHSDVMGFFISDPLEQKLPEQHTVPLVASLVDRKGGEQQRVTITVAQSQRRANIEAVFQARAQWLDSEFGQLGLPVISLSTSDDLLEAIHRPVSAHG